MPRTQPAKKAAASVPKAHAFPRKHFKHAVVVKRVTGRGAASSLTKIASALSGGASVGLATAVLVPGAPVVAGILAVAGVIGSGLLVKRYG